MAEHVWRQRRRALLPAKPDRAGNLAIPDPAPETRQAWHRRAVWQRDRRPFRFGVVKAGKECHRIVLDDRELLTCRFHEADIVGRPAALQRRLVGRQVFERRLDDFDHAESGLLLRSLNKKCFADWHEALYDWRS